MSKVDALRVGPTRRSLVARCAQRWLSLLGLTAWTGCSVYDPALLDGLGEAAPTEAEPAVGAAGSPATIEACGDGVLGADETCDTAIPAGAPGDCPIDCEPATCPMRVLAGAGCQAECIDSSEPCPPSTDGGCGDGVVDPAAGETCEAGAEPPCPTSCEDDADPCTSTVLTGSATTCDALCDSTVVTAALDGDGCCPEGATPSTDDDCMPTPEQEQCLALVDAADTCSRCACLACNALSLQCLDGPDATANAQCEAVVSCSRTNACRGDACSCGADLSTCQTMPMGPCVAEIEAAAGGMNISTAACDTGTALGLAVALGACTDSACVAECGTRTGTSSCAP